jgi:CBS domain containing-hemolysin-like protein
MSENLLHGVGEKVYNYFKKTLKKDKNVDLIDRLENLIEMDQSASKNNSEDNNEIVLVSNILGLKDSTAADIMVLRADIIAAKIDTSFNEFIEIFSKNNFSQIPIYKNTLDDVVKIRDFLPFINNRSSFNINSILKEAIYVVPSIQLFELLLEIKSSENHMALVVDEFG